MAMTVLHFTYWRGYKSCWFEKVSWK